MSKHLQPNFLPFNLRGLPLEDVYHKVDQEISVLQERLNNLRSFRNSLPPISKLPTEILSKIFIETQNKIGSSFPYKVDVQTRYFVSWVCRHWRDTAITTPALWTIISKKNRNNPIDVDLADELLDRSRNLNLSINLFRPTSDILDAFLYNMHRVRHMRVIGADPDDFGHYGRLFSQPVPLLLSLELSYDHTLEKLFSGVHPHLQHLVLRNLKEARRHRFHAFRIAGLTRLHIVNNDNIHLNHLVDILPPLTSLTQLVIARSMQDHLQHVTTPLQRIHLPKLVVISITEENIEPMFHFLLCLDVPQAAITITWPPEVLCSDRRVEEIMFALKGYHDQAQFPIVDLTVELEEPDFTIRMASTSSQHRHYVWFPNQNLDPYTGIYPFFEQSFQLNQLKNLRMTHMPGSALYRLKRLPNLTHVTLRGIWTVEGFLWGFTEDPNLFPALKKLVLIEYELRGDEPPLESFLAFRRDKGTPLDELVFVKSPKIDVTIYKDLVKTLTVE